MFFIRTYLCLLHFYYSNQDRVLGTQEYKLITYTFINRCSLLVMIINIWLHLQSCDSFASNKQTYKNFDAVDVNLHSFMMKYIFGYDICSTSYRLSKNDLDTDVISRCSRVITSFYWSLRNWIGFFHWILYDCNFLKLLLFQY